MPITGPHRNQGDLDADKTAMLRLLGGEIHDSRVLAAMAQVPREEFVPEGLRGYAYANRALGIGHGQTISQPLIVGLMTQALQLGGGERVLEIGTGSGYQAAILSLLSSEVVSVERVAALRVEATGTLADLGYRVVVHDAADHVGWPEGAPYDAILVTAAASEVPEGLLAQLRTPGRLVVPVGDRRRQRLLRIRKLAGGVTREDLGECAFVPLIGESGFDEG